MINGITIFLLLVACGILGRLVAELFIRARGPFQGDWLALSFASVTLGVTILGWIALVLAEFGVFTIPLLGALWVTMMLVMVVLILRGPSRLQTDNPDRNDHELSPQESPLGTESRVVKIPNWIQYALLGLWLVGASWLFFRPHEYLLGAADAGVYVNLSASIANSGGILIDDPSLAEFDETLARTLLRQLPENSSVREIAPSYLFPAFFVEEEPAGRITPQFYHLHPVWQAIGYSIGGVQSALLITGLWAILGSLSIYLVVRKISNWPVAFLTLIALSINALQIWFARYPTTELLTQYLLWAGLWATMFWLQERRPRPFWGLLGGLALGQVFLVRIDTYFLLVIPFSIFLWLRLSDRWRKEHWWFFTPIILLTAHSLIHAVLQSAPYFFSTFTYGFRLLVRQWALPLGALLVGAVVILILYRNRHELANLARYQRPLTRLAAALVLLLVIYGWFIRPYIGADPSAYDYWYAGGQVPRGLDRENLVRLGWYLSPLGIALATAGICLMILKINRLTAILLGTGLTFSLLYLWRIQANPHQIYTMRRYVPVVLPFAMIATGFLFGWISDRRRVWARVAGVALALAWLLGLGLSAQGFVRQVDYQGIVAELEYVDSVLEPSSILIFNDQSAITAGDTLGTPLHFIFGHDVYSLRDIDNLDSAGLAGAIRHWKEAGRFVYWVGDGAILEDMGLETNEAIDILVLSQELEGLYDRKPTVALERRWELHLIPIQ